MALILFQSIKLIFSMVDGTVLFRDINLLLPEHLINMYTPVATTQRMMVMMNLRMMVMMNLRMMKAEVGVEPGGGSRIQ